MRWLACSAVAYLLSATQVLQASPSAVLSQVIPDSFIVVFNDDVDTDRAAGELAGRFRMTVNFRYRHALKGMAIRMSPRLVGQLSADPRVAYITPDVIVRAAAQTLPSGVDRINAELDPATHIDGVDILADRIDADIAILDTGIDLDHPELVVVSFAYCIPRGPFKANCVEGDTAADDLDGHGTHVAGTAAAIDNGSGVVGVAPGARLWAVKVLENNGEGSGAQILAGVDYVTAHASEIEVANLSLTGTGSYQPLDDAIGNSVAAGVVYTLAAGNSSTDVGLEFPAGHPEAITVSAFEDYDGRPGGESGSSQDDSFAWFSNFGTGVDIMAPGVAIRSTLPGGGLGNRNGTSMAAPHVAGAAALYLAQHPGASPATVKTALLAQGDTAPCANSAAGLCADDPDGIQEPLLLLACDDADGDGVCDDADNCPLTANPGQTDTDADGIGDACDSCPAVDNASTTDMDGDGLTDFEECLLGTGMDTPDSDGDGLTDGDEVNIYGTDPLQQDSDGDLVADAVEVQAGTDPNDDSSFPGDGDLTEDGEVDVRDVLLGLRYLQGLAPLTSSQQAHGDLTQDGTFDLGDLVVLQRRVLGLP